MAQLHSLPTLQKPTLSAQVARHLLDLVAKEGSHVIVLAGEPLGEPIVQYGPFVMNTIEEIQQAFSDVERGKFGVVPE